MSSTISRKEVIKIAALTRLHLDEAELEMFSGQLSRIVDYVSKLNEVDIEGVSPLSHALPVANVFRDDVPAESLSPDEALRNAPQRTEHCFKVPRVLDDGSSA